MKAKGVSASIDNLPSGYSMIKFAGFFFAENKYIPNKPRLFEVFDCKKPAGPTIRLINFWSPLGHKLDTGFGKNGNLSSHTKKFS